MRTHLYTRACTQTCQTRTHTRMTACMHAFVHTCTCSFTNASPQYTCRLLLLESRSTKVTCFSKSAMQSGGSFIVHVLLASQAQLVVMHHRQPHRCRDCPNIIYRNFQSRRPQPRCLVTWLRANSLRRVWRVMCHLRCQRFVLDLPFFLLWPPRHAACASAQMRTGPLLLLGRPGKSRSVTSQVSLRPNIQSFQRFERTRTIDRSSLPSHAE